MALTMEIIGNKVLRCKDRDIILVRLPLKRGIQAFYKSSGKNSGKPGQWLPFDGLYIRYGEVVWFDKRRFVCDAGGRYHNVDHDCLHRFGTNYLKVASRVLGRWDIPKGVDTCPLEVNEWLGYENPFKEIEKA